MLLHQFYLVSTLSNSAYAAISSNMNTFVEKDGTIIEREILDGSDGKINFERITTPDGTTKVKVIENGHEYTREGSLDYDALKARIDGSEIKGTVLLPMQIMLSISQTDIMNCSTKIVLPLQDSRALYLEPRFLRF